MHPRPCTGSGSGFSPPKPQPPPWRRKQLTSSTTSSRTCGNVRCPRVNWRLTCSGPMVVTRASSRETSSWMGVWHGKWKGAMVTLLRFPPRCRLRSLARAGRNRNRLVVASRFPTCLVAAHVEESFSPETVCLPRPFDLCDVLRSAARGDGERAALGARPSNGPNKVP
jgi:hypothetical protein